MLWHLEDTDVTLHVDFVLRGVPVEPTAGSVSYTLRGNTGLPLAGHTDVPLPGQSGTGVDITIPAVDNANANTDGFETRHLLVSYTFEGNPYVIRASYRLCAFVPTTVVPADVRALLGLMEEELEDQEVDVHEAYFRLLERIPDLGTNLTGSGAMKANEALTIQIALQFLPGLPARYSQSWESADSAVSRSTKLDPTKLAEQLNSRLDTLVDALVATTPGIVPTPTLFLLTQPTDPITGA